MKKETVTKFLDTLVYQAKREQDEALRQAQVEAIQECRTWLQLTWADMLDPVTAKLKSLTTEFQPLLKKEEQSLTEQEQKRLQCARESYTIYHHFRSKISPTARRASVERGSRAQEKAQRK